MKNYLLIFGVFCTLATVAAVLLRPDAKVRFEAEVMDLEPEEALKMLDRSAKDLVYHDTLKLTHAQLALGAGNLKDARRWFFDLLDPENPSADILDDLAEVALLEKNLVEAAQFAKRAQDIWPSQDRRKRLSYWYRVLKDVDAELAVLATAAPETLTGWEVHRLGQLYLHKDDDAAYENLLAVLATSKRDDSKDFQHKLVHFYIGTSRFDAAMQTAVAGFDRTDQGTQLVQFTLTSLIEQGAIDPAQDLAIQILRAHPASGHTLVMPFVRAGHGGIARFLQDAWLSSADQLTTDQWNALNTFAEMTGDLSGLREALMRPNSGFGDPVPGAVFMQFVRYGTAHSLVPFRRYLTPEVLEENPLVAAAWTGWMNEPGTTYTHLVRASRLDLSDWDRSIWMSIAEGLKGTGYFSQLLSGTPSDAQLRTMLRSTVLKEKAASSDG